MRTFLAIELPENIKDYLSHLQLELKESQADVKWVEKDNLHLTVKFLGEIAEDKLILVKEIICHNAKDYAPFPAQLEGLGAFPSLYKPRVIWVGIGEGKDKCAQLAELLNNKLAEVSSAETKGFKPHITLGRVRSVYKIKSLTERLKKIKSPFENVFSFTVDKITLFQSTLTPTGPVYTPLARINLERT